MSSPEQRRKRRVYLDCTVKISHPDFGSRVVKAKDFSDSGIFLMMKAEELPPPGTIVTGQVQGMAEEAPVINMEVVRAQKGGVALKFCNPDDAQQLH